MSEIKWTQGNVGETSRQGYEKSVRGFYAVGKSAFRDEEG